MKKILVLFMPLFIISCALESEDTDTLYGKFAFTIAEAGIDNISNVAMNESKKICVPYSSTTTFNYHAKSSGTYGTDTESIIRNSYIESLSTKIYFYYDCTSSTNCASIPVEVTPLPNLQYNKSVTSSHVINIPGIGIVEGEEYLVSIIINGRERNGNEVHTADSQFGSYFGTVIFSDNCANYQ